MFVILDLHITLVSSPENTARFANMQGDTATVGG